MIRNKFSMMSVILAVSMVASNVAIAKVVAKEPAGSERAKQYEKVIADCRKKFGGQSTSLSAEWGGHYGRTGWWCVTRG